MLIRNTIIYTVLQFVNKGIPFLLLPILTRYLNTDDYGLIASFNTFIGLMAIFIGLSSSGAVDVNFFHLKKKELQVFIGNVFNILVISSLITLLLLSSFQYLAIKITGLPLMWLYIAILVALAQNFTGINLTLWRSQQQAKPFAFYEVSLTIFNVLLSLLLVISLKYGWQGRTMGTASTAILFGLLSVLFIFKRGFLRFNYSWHHIKDALKFGIPLIPHQFALWMRAGVDILLITSLLGVAETGLYSVGYQLGAVVGVLAHAFNNAYCPYLFNKLKNITAKDKYTIVKFTYIYFIGILIFVLVLSNIFKVIIPHFLGDSFQEAGKYIIWIALANAFQGMYLMVVNYIFYVKKTHLLSVTTITMSFFHVGMSYIFIKQFGAIGAAYASVLSSVLTFLFVWYLSHIVYPMPWRLSKMEQE